MELYAFINRIARQTASRPTSSRVSTPAVRESSVSRHETEQPPTPKARPDSPKISLEKKGDCIIHVFDENRNGGLRWNGRSRVCSDLPVNWEVTLILREQPNETFTVGDSYLLQKWHTLLSTYRTRDPMKSLKLMSTAMFKSLNGWWPTLVKKKWLSSQGLSFLSS